MSKAIMLNGLVDGSEIPTGIYTSESTDWEAQIDTGVDVSKYDYMIIVILDTLFSRADVPPRCFATSIIDFRNSYHIGQTAGSSGGYYGTVYRGSYSSSGQDIVVINGTKVSFDGYSSAPKFERRKKYRWFLIKNEE